MQYLAAYVYALSSPWYPSQWQSISDTLRGGISYSSFTPLPYKPDCIQFSGNLDTKTLGGAGFTAQFWDYDRQGAKSASESDLQDPGTGLDLGAYHGIEIAVGKGDGQLYTFILKDVSEPDLGLRRSVDRNEATVSWEAKFRPQSLDNAAAATVANSSDVEERDAMQRFWLPFRDFRAFYRGKEIDSQKGWEGRRVASVGIMMRRCASFFFVMPPSLSSLSPRSLYFFNASRMSAADPEAGRYQLFHGAGRTV